MEKKLTGKNLFSWPIDPGQSPYLIGNKCTVCGQLQFPAKQVCTRCLDDQLEEVHFGREGSLYSFSIVYVSSGGFKAPYAIGYVDLNEGIRLFSLILNWEKDNLRSGKKMELVIAKVGEDSAGDDLIGYAYQPRKG